MDLLLKQRLVGAAVIISLGIVIIPMLLDGSGSRIIQEIPPRPERQSVSGQGLVKDQSIPSPPKKDTGEIVYSSEPLSINPAAEAGSVVDQKSVPEQLVAKNVTNVTAEESGAAKTERQGASAKDAEVSEVKTSNSVVSKSMPTQKLASWVVQVGSFTEKDKAISLRDQLGSKGFTAFTEQFKNSQQNSMYRVRVGPVQKRSEAEAALRQIRQQIKLENGYVTSYP